MELPLLNINTTSATSRRWHQLQKSVEDIRHRHQARQDVRIIASSRGMMVDPVIEACEAGVAEFCEDYLSEGVTKKPAITNRFPNTIWHFTGILQPSKLHLVVEFFDWIDTLDRETLLKPLANACARHSNKKMNVLIEVNPLGLGKKTGVPLDKIAYLGDQLQKIPQINLKGLSCRSDLMMSVDLANEAYDLTRKEHEKLVAKGNLPSSAIELAMGSTRDMEKAILLGSTMVRVGSGLFGKSAASKMLAPVDEF